jgi:ABC-type multidrug transport system ATPase subunit
MPDTAVAYCGHDSWIINGSARDNILLGSSDSQVDEDRYRSAVEACALLDDFRGWNDGDKTVLGERGINSSGGQKARIALARALYSKANILLLDNVLAGLDATTAAHVIEHAILKVSSHRIILLCSHKPELLRYAKGVVSVVSGVVQMDTQSLASALAQIQGGRGSDDVSESVDTTETKKAVVSNSDVRAPKSHVSNVETNAYWEYFMVQVFDYYRCFACLLYARRLVREHFFWRLPRQYVPLSRLLAPTTSLRSGRTVRTASRHI